MEGFTKAMKQLSRAIFLLSVWTIITIITLIGIGSLYFVFPLLLNEPLYYTIVYAIPYAVILVLMMIGNRMVKDIQKSITFVFVRSFLGFILPIPLIILALTLIVKILFAVFTAVSFIIFILIFMPIRTLLKIQKQMSK
ncbi:MAG: hypothetical protein ACFFDP_12615 [Promethearchaeota archaeon]